MNDITHNKGILRTGEAARNFTIERYKPSELLQDIVEHYWIIRWDIGDASYESQTIVYPAANIVFARKGVMAGGVDTNKFSYYLTGKGTIAGILFRAAGFSGLYHESMDALTNKTVPLSSLLTGIDVSIYPALLEKTSDIGLVKSMEELVIGYQPMVTEKMKIVNTIVDTIMNDKAILKVSDIINRYHITERSLQYLFKRYVGVSPKWVIMRCRIQEAAYRLSQSVRVDLAVVAEELGYSDQAHFIHDFKKTIGQTPSEYLKINHNHDE